jgi:ribosome-associated translation inhibitor RaiA
MRFALQHPSRRARGHTPCCSTLARGRWRLTIKVEGLPDPTLRELVTRKLRTLTRRVRAEPTSARLHFTDVNGPKGGPDTRCGITLAWPRRRTMHVEDVAVSPRHAFDEALTSLARRLAREVGQAREERRRPKKYFVAKRLLEPGTEGEGWISKLA